VHEYTTFLQDRAKAGAGIRFVLVDPANPDMLRSLGGFFVETTEAGFRADLENSLENIQTIVAAAKDREQVKIRSPRAVPTLSMVVVRSSLRGSLIIVELLPYRLHPTTRMHFVLRPMDAKFEQYLQLAETIWNDARRRAIGPPVAAERTHP
jgi:hypothetical protein